MTKIEAFFGKIKNFFRSNRRTAVFVLFLLELFISIWITPDQYDSAFFIEKAQEMSIFDFVSMRYQTWTSRIIIETILCIILPQKAIVWAILNTVMMTILGYSILKLLVKEDNKSLTWISICLILIYPLNKIATCDWGAGTINYTWPLAMLMFSSIALQKMWNGEKIPKWMYPIYSLALLFACNQEQACAIAAGLYFITTILIILKHKKKTNPFLFIEDGLVVLSFLLIVTCPGNYVRKTEEIATYYMDFQTLGLFDKISLGLTSTVNNLLLNTNLVFFVFSLISAVYLFRKYKNNLYRAIALIPLVACLIFGVGKDIVGKVYPYFGIFCETLNTQQAMLTPENYLNFINFVPLILAFVVLGSVALNILVIFKNLENNFAILIYGLGLMSRIALGFSPTVFASTDRTFLFFEFALLMISILIWQEFMKETDKTQVKARTNLATVIAVLAVLEYWHTILFVLMSQM